MNEHTEDLLRCVTCGDEKKRSTLTDDMAAAQCPYRREGYPHDYRRVPKES